MQHATADIVIVGGGIMGASAALHLVGSAAGARVIVVEQDPSYRACATTRSAGGVRQQFSTPECIAMSQATIALLRSQQPTAMRVAYPAVAPGTTRDVGFRECGYLLLASEAGAVVLADNVARQRQMGADTQLLAPPALAQRFPWLDTAGVAKGSFGASGEGWLDAATLLADFKEKAQAGGANFITSRVTALERAGHRITAVRLCDGRRIACGDVVNAAGAWAGAVAHMAGAELPVEPRKRFVFVIDCRDAPEALRSAPLTVDPSGVWFRPEGRQFICGVSPSHDADEPDPADLDVIDHALFEDRIWPVLADRVPVFAAIKVTSAWASHYDYNTFDQNAVIGPHDEVTNLYFCNGFSGHGLQHAFAAGRAVAELIVHGRFVTLDLTRLGYGRIRRHQPLIEKNVI